MTNNHYYIGCHSTNNLFDGYMGSGVLIKKAIDYYGIDNFEKVILKECKSKRDMYYWERRIITKDVIKDPNCYNLITGGKRRTKHTYKVKAKTKNCKELLNENNNSWK